jgi:hypothetical protein
VKPAITAGNGERLWERAAAADQIRSAAAAGRAVVGCEVYARHQVGWGTFITWWDVEPPRGPGEPWPAFVARCASYTLDRLDDDPLHLFFLAIEPRSGNNSPSDYGNL